MAIKAITEEMAKHIAGIGQDDFKKKINTLRGSATQNRLIFQLFFFMPKMKLYVYRNLCENFRQIGQKMKKL